MKNKNVRQIRSLTFISPFLFSAIFFLIWLVMAIFDRDHLDLKPALIAATLYAPICMGLGYTYVLLTHGFYYLLRKWGKVESFD